MGMTATPPAPAAYNRDWWIPWTFVWAFLLLFVIDGTLVYLAVSTRPGVVVERAYERGLAYNQYLAEADAQKARGWQSHVVYEGNQLSLALAGKDGQPLQGATITAQFVRPVHDGEDFTLPLEESAPGVYIKTVTFPQPGKWNVRISATWQNQPYQVSQELIVR
jgi:nitrogen fixation protein FixH